MIHEAGHLIVAKMCDVQVNVYSIGFGPRIIGFKFLKGKVAYKLFNRKSSSDTVWELAETEYRLAPFLLGGFCSMAGEISGEDNPRALASKPYLQKVAVALAGAFANIVTGFVALLTLVAPVYGIVRGSKLLFSVLVELTQVSYAQTVALIMQEVPMARWSEIANASAQISSYEGLVWQFGSMSILLALFNLVPFPALDGSLPFIWTLEKILGKKVGSVIANVLVYIGFTILMTLQLGILVYWIFF